MDVRRLAAIDMWGTRGTIRRRRIILAEFVIGVIVMIAVGLWIATASHTPIGYVIGVWAITAGLNYAPLAWYAIRLSPAGALEAELVDVDTVAELRRYSILQVWVFVPLALLLFVARRL